MPSGGVPLNSRTSSVSGFVSVTVAEVSSDVVAVGYQDVGVHDGDGWSPVCEGGQIVHATDRRAVRVEIERRRDVGNDVQEGRADIAVEVTVVDRDLNDAVRSGSARGVEDHLAQGCLVFCQGSLAGEREDAGNGIVGSRGDRYGQHPADREQIAGLRVRQRDRRQFDRSAVGVGDGNVGVGDRYLRPAAGERRGIVRPDDTIGIVEVEIEHRSSGDANNIPYRDERFRLGTPLLAVE